MYMYGECEADLPDDERCDGCELRAGPLDILIIEPVITAVMQEVLGELLNSETDVECRVYLATDAVVRNMIRLAVEEYEQGLHH